MLFRKRHYEAIAKVIKAAKERARSNAYTFESALQFELIQLFTDDNCMFDVDMFVKACKYWSINYE